MRRGLLFLIAMFVCLAFWGCKEECPMCDQHIKIMQECMKDNLPSADELEKLKSTCNEACGRMKSAKSTEERDKIYDTELAREACYSYHEEDGCDAWLQCMKEREK